MPWIASPLLLSRIRIRQRPRGPGRSAVVDRLDLDARAVDALRLEVRVDDTAALLHAQPVNHELEARGRPVVSVAVVPEEETHGATDVRDELLGNERVEHACAKALPSHAAADHDAKARLLPAARTAAHERGHADAVDVGLSTAGAAAGKADLELARQVVQVPRLGEKIGRPLRIGCHVDAGVRTARSPLTRGDVARHVTAPVKGRELCPGQVAHQRCQVSGCEASETGETGAS